MNLVSSLWLSLLYIDIRERIIQECRTYSWRDDEVGPDLLRQGTFITGICGVIVDNVSSNLTRFVGVMRLAVQNK